jgi:hypothetical protein
MWSRTLLEKVTVWLVEKISAYMESEVSIPCISLRPGDLIQSQLNPLYNLRPVYLKIAVTFFFLT